MYTIIMNDGNYQELPYTNTIEEAEKFMRLRYSKEEIKEKEMEIVDNYYCKEIHSIELIKEGLFYTIYINGIQGGCGDLDDMVDDLSSYINMYNKGTYNEYL